jgi:hypothetical protein
MAKKKSDETVPAVTCFEIANELAAVTEKIVSQGGEVQEGDFEALQHWQAALEVKAESIGHVLERLASEAAYYKAVEAAAAERRKAREAARERLRDYLLRSMVQAGVKSVKHNTGLFSVTVVDGRPSVRIEDETKLPFDLTTITMTIAPRKKEILELLQKNETVPGASLEYGAPYLMIR